MYILFPFFFEDALRIFMFKPYNISILYYRPFIVGVVDCTAFLNIFL